MLTTKQKIFILIFGILFLCCGIGVFFYNRYLVKNCTMEVEAIVVGFEESFSSDDDGGNYIYYPIIEYKVENDTIRVEMNSGSSNPKYKIGDNITILYNPNKPKEYIVKGDNLTTILFVAFTGVGTVLTGVGVFILFKKN